MAARTASAVRIPSWEGHGPELHPGPRRGRGLLPVDEVARGLHDGLGARPPVDHDGRLVGHDAAGEEEGSLLPQQSGDAFFEAADRGVVAELVIAHLRGGDGLAHPGRRAGDRVAAEVDHPVWSARYFALEYRSRPPRPSSPRSTTRPGSRRACSGT
jgi:hypothetical protein